MACKRQSHYCRPLPDPLAPDAMGIGRGTHLKGSPVLQAKAPHYEGPGRSTCTVHAKTSSRISPWHPRKLPMLIRVECKSMRFGKQIQEDCHCWLFRDNLRGQE